MVLTSLTYNYDSLNDAFNLANRKGRMQKRYLSTEYLDCATEYREMRKVLNKLIQKKKVDRSEDENQMIDELRTLMLENSKQQKELLRLHLTKVSKIILSNDFRFNLTVDLAEDADKPLYLIGNTAEEYFAMQVLCRNIKNLFKLKITSREELLSQLKLLLQEDKNRLYIIRTDVCSCFESIPHDKLFEYIENNSLLDVKSKSLLRGLIKREFESKNLRPVIKTPNTGVPRGCAVSSLLSELYLSKIDVEVKNELPGVVFLGRYVDDIILIIHPAIDEINNKDINWYLDKLSAIYNNKGLTVHSTEDEKSKCEKYDTSSSSVFKFDLLGYNIIYDRGNDKDPVKFSLSADKFKKLKKRIKKAFEIFDNLLDTATYDIAAHYLFDALHVLSANINLYNAKKGVKVGIFYSNTLLDNEKALISLDKYLKRCIDLIDLSTKICLNFEERTSIEQKLKAQLKLISFQKGFGKLMNPMQMPKRYKIKRRRFQVIKNAW